MAFHGLTWSPVPSRACPRKIRLRIGNLAKAVLVSGQAYQDPKDALNEFVSNAADEYAEADRTGERIRVLLRPGASRLPTVAPDPNPGEGRSRFDPEQGTRLFNDTHADDLMVKDSEAVLLDYLATLVAKEYVVFNNPRASAEELGEELVRMLVRVRRHIPRRS